MRRWWRYLLLFTATYLLALMVTLPASLALHWATPLLAQVPARPTLHGVEGTLWHGHAAQFDLSGINLGAVQWDISVWPLLLGRVDTELTLLREDGQVTTQIGWRLIAQEWSVERLEGQLPAALLGAFMPRAAARYNGTLALNLEHALFAHGRLQQARGRVVWNSAGLVYPLQLELGDFVVQLSSGQGVVLASVHDGGGPLQLDAELQLTPDYRYQVSGKVLARSSAVPALVTSLSLLGQPEADGSIPIRFAGSL